MNDDIAYQYIAWEAAEQPNYSCSLNGYIREAV